MEKLFALLSFGPDGWGDELLVGAWVTVRLALATLPFGLALGLLVALAKNSKEPTLVLAGNIYTTIFRGLPELLTLFLVYYGGQIVFQKVASLFTDAAVEVNGFIAGMIALGFVFSAYSSEAFLGAFKAISRGQYEAGQALGLSTFKTFRLIILPQLIRLTLPALSNLWLVLLKETSLVSVIAYEELLRKTFIAVGVTKQPLLFFSAAALIYLALALASSTVLGTIDARLRRGERRLA
jgi:polar amino acid transport system permease protein